jgi:hypothetical protein
MNSSKKGHIDAKKRGQTKKPTPKQNSMEASDPNKG